MVDVSCFPVLDSSRLFPADARRIRRPAARQTYYYSRGATLSEPTSTYHDLWDQDLEDVDPKIAKLIDREKARQARKLIFIPSESFCIRPIRQGLQSVYTNIYAEGYPRPRMDEEPEEQLHDTARQLSSYRRYADRRFYKGTENVDILECLAHRRVAKAFENKRVSADDIYVNVQPLSGAAANNSIYEAFVDPGDTVMGMELAHGGHLTHGSPFNRSGKRYDIVSYEVDPDTEKLNYDRILQKAREHEPEIVIAGFTSYPWAPDWTKFREIADEADALLLADIAHTAGLVIGGAHPSPVGIADIVNFTTHKSVFGPRGAVILTTDPELSSSINRSIFPGEQGGPHTNKFASIATAFKIAQREDYKKLQQRIVDNASALAEALEDEGLRIPYGGTDTHLLLFDASAAYTDSDWELWGEVAARIMDMAGLVANKNTIPGDENAADARGIRLGTPWLTQRGFEPEDMTKIAEPIARLIKNIHPFQYQGATRILPRGKIELDLLESVSQDVSDLAESAYAEPDSRSSSEDTLDESYPDFVYLREEPFGDSPLREHHRQADVSLVDIEGVSVPEQYGDPETIQNQLQTDAVLIDRSDLGLIEVSDWRSDALLHEATTRNIYQLEEGEGLETLLLDADGNGIGEVEIYRLERKRFFLFSHPEHTRDVLSWLRGLSDGYIVFDRDDIRRKVQGPAVVENLRKQQDQSLTALQLQGAEADRYLKELPETDETLTKLGITRTQNNDRISYVCTSPAPTGSRHILLMPNSEAKTTWTSLLDNGVQPGGRATLQSVREQASRPSPENLPSLSGSELLDGQPELFDREKCYFVGQLPLEKETTPETNKSEHTWTPPEETKETTLHDVHEEMGARMIPFGGWEMPVQYEGILDEHRAVRNQAGLFDVGHMGVLQFTGKHAKHFLDLVTSNYASWLRDGESQYGFILTPDAEVMDDMLLYRRGEEDFFMVVNAANKERVEAWFRAVNSGDVIIDPGRPHVERPGPIEIRDMKHPKGGEEGRMDLALQGPNSFKILRDLIEDNDTLIRRINNLKRFEFLQDEIRGMDLIVSKTGYTGEKVGFELYVDPQEAEKLWRLLLDTGEQHGIKPAGLGARDTVRIEAGLPLHGHDLNGKHNISPFGAGYGAFVKWHKPFFIGREALMDKEQEREDEIIRFRIEEKGRPIREGGYVADPESGTCIGTVTSALVKRGSQIGLAYVDRSYTGTGTDLMLLSERAIENTDNVEKGSDLSGVLENGRKGTVLTRFLTAGGESIGWGEEE